MATNSATQQPTTGADYYTRIEATQGWALSKLSDLWAFRELLFFLTWRDIKVRYKQTILGASWAILQPLLTMVVFNVFFKRGAGIGSGTELPYAVWSYSALIGWTFFSSGVSQASNSLVSNANMIKKIYFPRITMPLATIFSALVDFALAFLVLIGMMFWFGIAPSANLFVLPFFILLAVVAALGISLWLSAMNVQFRDVRYTIPFLLQLWLFISPLPYPLSRIPEEWRLLYSLNPMVSVAEGFRWSILGGQAETSLTISMVAISTVVALVIFIGGIFYFSRMEKTFADVV